MFQHSVVVQVRLVKDKGEVITIPAAAVTEISYGQDAHRRVGAAIGIAVFTLGIGALMALTKFVKRRLEEVGLGHLAIDLHGADLSPKKVMQQVAHTLEVVGSSVPVNCQEVHAQLVDRRTRLNETSFVLPRG